MNSTDKKSCQKQKKTIPKKAPEYHLKKQRSNKRKVKIDTKT